MFFILIQKGANLGWLIYIGLIDSFENYLEIPLQPLYDNLDSHTYEVFERDPVKYIFYQRAIEQALLDKIPAEEAETKTVSWLSFCEFQQISVKFNQV